jgi:hypothetical protein
MGPASHSMRKQFFVSLTAVCVGAVAGFSQELNWTDLAGRPELWPAQCTLQHAAQFEGGVSVHAGQKLNVFQVKPNEAEVGTLDGRTNFTVEPDETDLLPLARAAYTKLTPKQRSLTYAAIAQQKEVWPAQIMLKKTLRQLDALLKMPVGGM